MSAVATEAGVATGTAYVHYASKNELVLAAHVEAMKDLSAAALEADDARLEPAIRFRRLWLAVYRHLTADPVRARFLAQVEHSPYAIEAKARRLTDVDPLLDLLASPVLDEFVADLPLSFLHDLGFGPSIRLAASDVELTEPTLDRLVEACWRSITA
ncbi:MAG: AcrR family transcriptional regulator [Acidimicrobiales bacterium]|jgi:AcrR family transcriptional regulator